MPLDLQTLKARITDRLLDWWPRARHAGLTSVYAGFAAATLIPLVEASRHDPVGARMLLGSLVSGVWGNVIADQLGRWRDATSPPSVDEVARFVAHQVASDPLSREGLDEMLVKLEAAALARSALAAEDARTLMRTLEDELAHLVSLPRFQASLVGDGRLAQAGQGGIKIGRAHV